MTAAESVTDTLARMSGVWHDRVRIFALDGTPLEHDPWGGAPGPAPFENLVYVDFDGEDFRQTNVSFRGRPLHVRTFTGRVVDGVLHFDRLGPESPEHIGVSGGPGILVFAPSHVTEAWARYSEPDVIRLLDDDRRTRTTILYRDGEAVRTLTADGTRVAATAGQRVDLDPRGIDGSVHARRSETEVFRR